VLLHQLDRIENTFLHTRIVQFDGASYRYRFHFQFFFAICEQYRREQEFSKQSHSFHLQLQMKMLLEKEMNDEIGFTSDSDDIQQLRHKSVSFDQIKTLFVPFSERKGYMRKIRSKNP